MELTYLDSNATTKPAPSSWVAAVAASGVTLTATVLSAAATLPDDLGHGTQITMAWPDSAVHDLTN